MTCVTKCRRRTSANHFALLARVRPGVTAMLIVMTVVAAAACSEPATVSYPPHIEPELAANFRQLVESTATASAVQPLRCRFRATTLGGSSVDGGDLAYTLVIDPIDGPDGETDRDYAVLFSSQQPIANPDDANMPISGSQSLIVAFFPAARSALALEGRRYRYVFSAFLTDGLDLSVDDDERVMGVVFRKLDHSGTQELLTISCVPG